MHPELPKSGWTDEVHAALVRAMNSLEAPARKVAVFDFDNTCILGDIGELFSHYLIDECLYAYELDAFWDLVDPLELRRALRTLTDEARALPPADRAASAVYQRYLAELGALYPRKLNRDGKAECFSWAVRLHVGMAEVDMVRWTAETVEREVASERAFERRTTEDGEPVVISRGIRYLREIAELFASLETHGVEVWIVSASNWWSVKTGAQYLGIPEERVIGNRALVDGGRLTADNDPPVLFGAGKVDAIDKYIGVRPWLAFGDAETDFEMLDSALGQAVLIDPGNEKARKRAATSGWLVQPRETFSVLGFDELSGR